MTRSRPLIVKPAVKEHFFYATGVKAWRVDDADALQIAIPRGAGHSCEEAG